MCHCTFHSAFGVFSHVIHDCKHICLTFYHSTAIALLQSKTRLDTTAVPKHTRRKLLTDDNFFNVISERNAGVVIKDIRKEM